MYRSQSLIALLALVVSGCASNSGPTSTSPTTTTVASVTNTTPEAATVTSGEAWILYQASTTGQTVFLVRPDCTGAHSPTANVPGYNQTNPDWSPDGQQIVFVVSDSHGTDDL